MAAAAGRPLWRRCPDHWHMHCVRPFSPLCSFQLLSSRPLQTIFIARSSTATPGKLPDEKSDVRPKRRARDGDPQREELPFCRENCYALRGPKGVHSGMQIALFSCILCERHFPSSSVHQARPPCVKLRQASGAGNDATTTNNFNSFSWHQT